MPGVTVYVDDAFVAGEWGFFTRGGHLQADALGARADRWREATRRRRALRMARTRP